MVSLIRSNTTRWDSDYNSLIRAFELRDPLEEFVSRVLRRNKDQENDGTPASLQLDELTPADWNILREIMHILQPFRKWQLILQSKNHFGQLHDIFPAMDELLYQLEQSREHEIPHIRTSVDLAWNVLNKYEFLFPLQPIHWLALFSKLTCIRYYTLTDLVPAHFLAVALNPEMKYKYFENEWEDRPDWIENAKSTVEIAWQSEYKPSSSRTSEIVLLPVAAPRSTSTQQRITPQSSLPGELPRFSDLPDWKKKKRRKLIGDDHDELQRYLERETEDDLPSGPLQYWIDHLEDIRQKGLAQMTIDIFTIPAMSADPERLFSRYGHNFSNISSPVHEFV